MTAREAWREMVGADQRLLRFKARHKDGKGSLAAVDTARDEADAARAQFSEALANLALVDWARREARVA